MKMNYGSYLIYELALGMKFAKLETLPQFDGITRIGATHYIDSPSGPYLFTRVFMFDPRDKNEISSRSHISKNVGN